MKWIWLIIVALIIIVGGWFLFVTDSSAPAVDTEKGEMMEGGQVIDDSGSSGAFTTEMVPTEETVVYDGTKFVPEAVTIKKGGTVTFLNQSGGVMWVASAVHPTHAVYDGSSMREHCASGAGDAFDQCVPEIGDYSFTFNKTGSWNYHDHRNPAATGRVLVVE